MESRVACGTLYFSVRYSPLADRPGTVHAPSMTLKNASFLGLVVTILLTVLVAADFAITLTGVLREIVPAMALVRSLVHLLASLTVTVFFYVFQKGQS